MNRPPHSRARRGLPKKDRGMALIFVLIMLLLVFSVATLSSKIGLQGMRIAGAERDRNVAFQAAEAALIDAEIEILDPAFSDRSCNIHELSSEPGCSKNEDSRGVCVLDETQPNKPLYKLVNFEEADDTKRKYVVYGEFTRREFSFKRSEDVSQAFSGAATPADVPKYFIERVTTATPIMGVDGNGVTRRLPTTYKDGTFLVTALGYGYSKNTQVMLQALVFAPMKSGRCAGVTLR